MNKITIVLLDCCHNQLDYHSHNVVILRINFLYLHSIKYKLIMLLTLRYEKKLSKKIMR